VDHLQQHTALRASMSKTALGIMSNTASGIMYFQSRWILEAIACDRKPQSRTSTQ
jgi:hypothetical protein